MIPKPIIVLRVGIAVVAVTILSIYALDQLHIDGCLDMGGSIDYESFRCDLTQTHPKGSYIESRWRRYVLPIVALAGWLLLAKRIEQRVDDRKSDDDSGD